MQVGQISKVIPLDWPWPILFIDDDTTEIQRQIIATFNIPLFT